MKETPKGGGAHPDVAVVGAGLIGLACARALVAAGLRVVVLEAGELAGQASWASAGMIAPLAEVPQKGPFFEVCRHGRDLWRDYAPRLAEETGHHLDYDSSGALALPEPPAYLDTLEKAAAAMGEECRRLDGASARELLPDLAPQHQEVLHLPGEHRVDNRALCAALVAWLEKARQEGRGAELRRGFRVTAIESGAGGVRLHGANGETIAAGQAVVAAGAWSGQIAGLPALPVGPVHGQMIALGEIDWPWQGCLRGEHFYAVRRQGGRLLVGATAEEIGFSPSCTLGGLQRLTAWTAANFPGLVSRPLLETWSGLRPATPDRLPVVGPLDDGVLAATAHFRNGILLAPWTAARVAELATGRAAAGELDRAALELFSPRRFAL